MGEKGEVVGDLGVSAKFGETGDPERPRVLAVGELRYESVEVLKSSSSETGLEQVEIVIDDFILAFETLSFNMSSQPDFN